MNGEGGRCLEVPGKMAERKGNAGFVGVNENGAQQEQNGKQISFRGKGDQKTTIF